MKINNICMYVCMYVPKRRKKSCHVRMVCGPNKGYSTCVWRNRGFLTCCFILVQTGRLCGKHVWTTNMWKITFSQRFRKRSAYVSPEVLKPCAWIRSGCACVEHLWILVEFSLRFAWKCDPVAFGAIFRRCLPDTSQLLKPSRLSASLIPKPVSLLGLLAKIKV